MEQRKRFTCLVTFALAASTSVPGECATTDTRAITIEDVLGIEHLDQVELAPAGDWIAAVVQRPANDGEIYGRTAYETDPSRNDVWLISRSTRERRNITNGSDLAAGFWCAKWSPDGRRLAMLSTRPEGAEPRGGDNVRLYVWDRDSGQLSRLGDVAMMTQTRYGGAIHRLDLRGGANHGGITHACGGENAPFLWLEPLAAIATSGDAALRWLAGSPPNLDRARLAINRVVEDANRASTIIGRVREHARGDAPNRQMLGIDDVVVEAIELSRSEIDRHGISLQMALADQLPPIWGDKVQLQQVICNLILNAIEAMVDMPAHKRALSISAVSDASGDIEILASEPSRVFRRLLLVRRSQHEQDDKQVFA